MQESTYVAPIVCKTPEEIESYLSTLEFYGFLSDNYLDFDDSFDPLKSQIISRPLNLNNMTKPLTLQK